MTCRSQCPLPNGQRNAVSASPDGVCARSDTALLESRRMAQDCIQSD
jgi:hypothetical protein